MARRTKRGHKFVNHDLALASLLDCRRKVNTIMIQATIGGPLYKACEAASASIDGIAEGLTGDRSPATASIFWCGRNTPGKRNASAASSSRLALRAKAASPSAESLDQPHRHQSAMVAASWRRNLVSVLPSVATVLSLAFSVVARAVVMARVRITAQDDRG
jgi:hypothetical protein